MSVDKEKKPAKTAAKPKKATTATEEGKKTVTRAAKSELTAKKSAPKAKPSAKAAANKSEAVIPVTNATPRPTHAQIADLAYSYFLQRRGQHGHHEQDWFRAERELKGIL